MYILDRLSIHKRNRIDSTIFLPNIPNRSNRSNLKLRPTHARTHASSRLARLIVCHRGDMFLLLASSTSRCVPLDRKPDSSLIPVPKGRARTRWVPLGPHGPGSPSRSCPGPVRGPLPLRRSSGAGLQGQRHLPSRGCEELNLHHQSPWEVG